MPYGKRMNRMVSVRLSDQDYALLHELRRSTGCRNLSELARVALHNWHGDNPPAAEDGLQRMLQEHEERIRKLTAQLERFEALIEGRTRAKK